MQARMTRGPHQHFSHKSRSGKQNHHRPEFLVWHADYLLATRTGHDASTSPRGVGYNGGRLEVLMRSQILLPAFALFLCSLPAAAQTPQLSKAVKDFVRVDAAKIILTHVRGIDGTGAPAAEDRKVWIERGCRS